MKKFIVLSLVFVAGSMQAAEAPRRIHREHNKAKNLEQYQEVLDAIRITTRGVNQSLQQLQDAVNATIDFSQSLVLSQERLIKEALGSDKLADRQKAKERAEATLADQVRKYEATMRKNNDEFEKIFADLRKRAVKEARD